MRSVIAIVVLTTAVASAEDMKSSSESPAKVALDLMKKYDSNDDGFISKAECPSPEMFKRYDGDGDGKVTAVEIRNQEQSLRRKEEAAMPKRGEVFRGLDDFGLHDANADGRFTKRELESFVHDSCDQNRDGSVSEDEYKYVDIHPGGDEKAVDVESFDKLDENKDRKLSVAEFALSKGYLDALDRNDDGVVSKEEIIEAILKRWGGVPGPGAEAAMRRMDANGDGELTRKEFDGKDRLWDEINRYQPEKEDPTISKEEMERYFERVRDLRQKANSFVTRYDMNGDGKVTRDEFDGPDGAFARCDTNGDGLVSKADGVD